MVLNTADVWQKLQNISTACEMALQGQFVEVIPLTIARDIAVLPADQHPPKLGLAGVEGQARLLHDLASIELQAMELAFRTLIEFPQAPAEFRKELQDLTLSEARHLKACLEGLATLGYEWGHWPIHTMLWQSVASHDSLLDRILIVHRYLEGSGLDAGDSLRRRLTGVRPKSCVHDIIQLIVDEELGHVNFGSHWYREICQLEGLDPEVDFPERYAKLKTQMPKRLDKVNEELRARAGFSPSEIDFLRREREARL